MQVSDASSVGSGFGCKLRDVDECGSERMEDCTQGLWKCEIDSVKGF